VEDEDSAEDKYPEPERPPDDASAAEIARWMEADMEASIIDGLMKGLDEQDDEE
jgi:hypothetical protein